MPESTAARDVLTLADGPSAGPVLDLPTATVLGLFEARAAAAPKAPALAWAEQRLSYRELNDAAERVCAVLRLRGAGRGSRVAVCLDRSADLVIGLLGVWKAGGVYLPVDLEYPVDRISHLLTDSSAEFVLTRSDLAPRVPESAAAVVLLDEPVRRRPGPPVPGLLAQDEPAAGPGPADPAYLIYTSGSTGLPKGVLVNHSSLLNVVLELAREMPCGPDDRWLAMAAAGFDISMAEFCVPLATGAELLLSSAEQLREPRRLVRLIHEKRVSRMQAVPSQWRLLLDAGLDAPWLVAMVGGENLGVNLAQELRGRVAGLFNGYGPTETTVLSTLWRVPEEVDAVSIGAPIANTRLYLLGTDLRSAHDGEIGELFIAGAGVAVGYADRPELTAERFLPEPGRRDGSLMYRTGDRCRRRADGLLEFVGRADDQVKVNGRRIELGEVEAALSAMPGVAGVAVAVYDEGGGGAVLVAYVVPAAASSAPSAAEMRAFGRTLLPSALVPGLLVALDRFPLTPHGKVDRRALPAPQKPRAEPAADADGIGIGTAAGAGAGAGGGTGAGDGLLAEVCGICREVLDVARVLPGDDLADLGATSFALMQIAGRMHTRWAVDIPLEVFYDHDTIAELAAAIGTVVDRR